MLFLLSIQSDVSLHIDIDGNRARKLTVKVALIPISYPL
jgi:hypothetical protein